jgi:hypothetical protein
MIIDDIVFRRLLNKGEEIKYVAHAHPFTIYPQLFKVMIFGLIAPASGYFLFPPFYVIWIAWAALGVLLFLYRIMQWYLDAWIVTNMGVIDQDWNSLFNKATTRIDYSHIEGVTNEIKGFWGTIMRYGHIQIEHMSGQPITIDNVASPRKVEKHIAKYQQEFLRQQSFTDHSKLRDLLTDMVRSVTN